MNMPSVLLSFAFRALMLLVGRQEYWERVSFSPCKNFSKRRKKAPECTDLHVKLYIIFRRHPPQTSSSQRFASLRCASIVCPLPKMDWHHSERYTTTAIHNGSWVVLEWYYRPSRLCASEWWWNNVMLFMGLIADWGAAYLIALGKFFIQMNARHFEKYSSVTHTHTHVYCTV